ncbi:MAG: immunity 53 family protein [Gammaproteobacteria bacterium]
MNDILTWTQTWFLSQCNEVWEHTYGVKIDTLDNPGWSVVIDLVGTKLEGTSIEAISLNRTEEDWVNCSVSNNQYKGYGGPQNLVEILSTFRQWAESAVE